MMNTFILDKQNLTSHFEVNLQLTSRTFKLIALVSSEYELFFNKFQYRNLICSSTEVNVKIANFKLTSSYIQIHMTNIFILYELKFNFAF